MSRTQLSLAGMIGFVVVLGLDFTALARPSEWSAASALLLTIGVLLMATLGARFGRGPRGFGWGFALFGWVYLALAFGSWSFTFEVGRTGEVQTRSVALPTTRALILLRDHVLDLGDTEAVFDDRSKTRYIKALARRAEFTQAGHAAIALLLSLAGGLAGALVAGPGPEDRPGPRRRGPDLGPGATRERWVAALQEADEGRPGDPDLPTLPLRDP